MVLWGGLARHLLLHKSSATWLNKPPPGLNVSSGPNARNNQLQALAGERASDQTGCSEAQMKRQPLKLHRESC
ncbi:unnamed protein product [Caretta caretta]